jgi:DNA sulfur modification protein DndC
MFDEIKESLRNLYLDDNRPWLLGFSSGKDSTLVASLVFEVVAAIPEHQRKKPVSKDDLDAQLVDQSIPRRN